MDKLTEQTLEQALTRRERARGEKLGTEAPTPTKPLYVQDLEERARRLGITVDEVYERDQQVLSLPHPTPECLRADEVMLCVRDEKEMSRRAWEHFSRCGYCQGLVATARPDATRYQGLVSEMAGAAGDAAPAAPVIRRTEAIFAVLDKGMRRAVKGGGVLVGCFLLVFFLTPDHIRTKAPTWAWTDSQLQQRAVEDLKRDDAQQATDLTSKLIQREPRNPGWYLLRSEARWKEGMVDLAVEDFSTAIRLLEIPEGDGISFTMKRASADHAVAISRDEFKQFTEVWGKLSAQERDSKIRALTRDMAPRDREAIRAYLDKLSGKTGGEND